MKDITKEFAKVMNKFVSYKRRNEKWEKKERRGREEKVNNFKK